MTMEWCVPVLLLVLTMQTEGFVPVIQAPWGTVQGVSVEGDGGRKMNAYLAIPYALPPVGDRRFEKPQPHPGPGEGQVFVADQVMPPCPQVPVLIGSARKTSEDCLMLDVYVPADSSSGPHAVMFFIHGGAFTMGDAYTYRPSRLVADGNVIVVVIQYRLGILGFLSAGDDTLPGNAGLWDQNLALKWVNDNIQAFGGDPDRITIFGESAGSASVGFHLLMPPSKGLFKRAILQSGVPQDVAALGHSLNKKAAIKNYADLFECQGDNSRQLLQCLKQQPVDLLLNKSTEYAIKSPLRTHCLPFPDGELIPGDLRQLVQDSAFLQENAVGEVDIILGFNKDEGSVILFLQQFEKFPMEVMYSSSFFGRIRDMCFTLLGLTNNPILKKSAEFFYRGAEASSNTSQTMDPVINMHGDCLFNAAIVEWARYLAAASHSAARYLYVVDHDFVFNNQGPLPGAHHGDELLLLFDSEREVPEDCIFPLLNKTAISAEEWQLADTMVAMWTTFAKTGNPSPPIQDSLGGDWPKFTTEDEAYLSIARTFRVVTQVGPYRDRVALWLHHLRELNDLTAQMPVEEKPEEEPTSKDEL